MTEAIFLHDSYAKEMDARVEEVIEGKFIVLDKTVFYPQGGGQPGDVGALTHNGKTYQVSNTVKKDGKILHELSEPGLSLGDTVHGKIDWDRRYLLMRYHTAAHILSAVVHEHAGALISGNQIATDKLRIDFSLDAYDPNQMQHYVDEANRVIAKHLDVSVHFMPREEALKLPGVVKLAGALPPNIPELRILTIGSGENIADEQADGGTHVHNTREIGVLKLQGLENKGKNNRRMSVVLT